MDGDTDASIGLTFNNKLQIVHGCDDFKSGAETIGEMSFIARDQIISPSGHRHIEIGLIFWIRRSPNTGLRLDNQGNR